MGMEVTDGMGVDCLSGGLDRNVTCFRGAYQETARSVRLAGESTYR